MSDQPIKVLVNVQYACGCGFKTLTLKEAEEHVAKTFHTISCFSGSIAPETKLPRYTPYHHFVADINNPILKPM